MDPAKRPVFVNDHRKRIRVVQEIIGVVKPVKMIGVDNQKGQSRK